MSGGGPDPVYGQGIAGRGGIGLEKKLGELVLSGDVARLGERLEFGDRGIGLRLGLTRRGEAREKREEKQAARETVT